MSFQPAIPIYEAIRNIDTRKYLVPSIQREFTWWEDQIRWLFDSLMQGYPINSFLFWAVEGNTKQKFKFYEILKDYVERHRIHNNEFSTKGVGDFFGILDGQQRLTSLYIGLKGSFAWHKYHASWIYSEDSFPPRRLYLNITGPVESDDEEGQEYRFQFLTDNEYKEEQEKWFLVGDILEITDIRRLLDLIQSDSKFATEFAKNALSRLQAVVHTHLVINYYVERDQDIDKALNIFIRINKNGTPLDFSDLVMSIVVAHWKTDAKKAINDITGEIFRNYGFQVDKDFLLKAYLFLHSDDIRFKVNNFSVDTARHFESQWQKIRSAVLTLFRLVRGFGFVDHTLSSRNALLPILYYIYHLGMYKGFDSEVKYELDRANVRKWLHIVLLKQTFGASSDTLLKAIRSVFTEDFRKSPMDPMKAFPAEKIIKQFIGTNKDMSFDDVMITNLMKTQKDSPRAFSILALLYPHLDYRNGDFHKDHLHPASYFTDESLKAAGIAEQDLEFFKNSEHWNSILNLQLLDGNDNKSKNCGELKSWVERRTKELHVTSTEFCAKRLFPEVLEFADFREFISQREKILQKELANQLQF